MKYFDKAVAYLQAKYPIRLILVSLGREGSRAYMGGKCVQAAPFIQEHTIETTGIGISKKLNNTDMDRTSNWFCPFVCSRIGNSSFPIKTRKIEKIPT